MRRDARWVLFVLALPIVLACGTLEIGIERTPTPILTLELPSPTPTSRQIVLASPSATLASPTATVEATLPAPSSRERITFPPGGTTFSFSTNLTRGMIKAYVLTIYALCAPAVLALRKLPPRVLIVLGALLFASTAVLALVVQAGVNSSGAEDLGWLWVSGDLDASAAVEGWVWFEAFARALAMMLIGVALYRSGFLAGRQPIGSYRLTAIIGLAIGLPFAVAGVTWQLATGFSFRIALSSGVLNTFATKS